jgi:hypothetical protein
MSETEWSNVGFTNTQGQVVKTEIYRMRQIIPFNDNYSQSVSVP